MASKINVGSLTINAQEAESFGQFIIERVFNNSQLKDLIGIQTGVQMKEQIVFAGLPDLMGIADSGCARPNSGADIVLTQKFWDPKKVGDTMINCQSDLDSKFKPYFKYVQEYKDLYDIEGSDAQLFLLKMVEFAVQESINRLFWLGDTAAAGSGVATAGLIADANKVYFNLLDGVWKQAFAAVTAGSLTKVAITQNALATKVLQLTLADGAALAYFELVYAAADPRLKSAINGQMLVTGELWENYRKSLQKLDGSGNIVNTLNGFKTLTWNGINIINMEVLWLKARTMFEGLNDHSVYMLPNRIIYTVPENLSLGTLNEQTMETLESFYDPIGRQNYTGFGYTLDAKLLEEYMAVVAY